MPRAAVCKGCEAQKQEITFLREQLREAQDRLLAAVSPQALAQLRGKPVGAQVPQVAEFFTDDKGQGFVTVNGRAVPIEQYQALMEKGGYLDQNGAFIPATEAEAAANKLNEMLGGRA